MKDHHILLIGGYRVVREIGRETGWTQFDAFAFDTPEKEEIRKADVIIVCIDQIDTRPAAFTRYSDCRTSTKHQTR